MAKPWERDYEAPAAGGKPWERDYGTAEVAATAPEPSVPRAGFVESLGRQINPVGMAQGVSQAVAHPIETAKGYGAQNQELWRRTAESFDQGDYLSAVRHGISYLLNGIPGLGATIDEAGNEAGGGNLAGGMGTAVGVAATSLAPQYVPKVASAVKRGAQQMAGRQAEHLMQSALKPGVADAPSLDDVRLVVDTALKNKIPVTEVGAKRLADLLGKKQNEIQKIIDYLDNQEATVSRDAVASRVQQVRPRYEQQALPGDDIKILDKATDEFRAAHPAQIPAGQAQRIKQGTYQQTYAKAAESKATRLDIEKTLARGFKEELEGLAPELKALNASEGSMLELQGALERGLRRIGNKELVGLGDVVAGGGGGVAGGPVGAAVGTVLKRTVDSPALKSRLAIALYEASKKSGQPRSFMQSYDKAGRILAGMAAAGQQQAGQK